MTRRNKTDAPQAPKLRTARLARGAITGLAVVRAGAAHLGYRARRPASDAGGEATADAQARRTRHEAELGEILFQALNQLKGTALKVSQLLSMETNLLPEGVRAVLARGCHQATPLNRALVHKVFQQEFGQPPSALFPSFEDRAFAAASLGQVHHAVLPGGEAVVVKVQYPGIAASVGSDMRMIRSLLQGLRLGTDLLPSRAIVERTLDNVERTLAEELDYTHEAGQLRWFAAHAQLPGLHIPQPVEGLCTQRVLTLQQAQGVHLDAWLAARPTQRARNRAGQLLFDWFMHSVFDWGRLHADPHPGNFLFMPDGSVSVLDFGCTRAISPGFAQAIARSWRALLARGEGATPAARAWGLAELREAYLSLGLISPTLSEGDFEQQLMPAITALQAWQIEPFRHTHFNFAKRSAYPAPTPAEQRTVSRLMTGMSEELPYFERAVLGLSHMLKALKAEVRTDNPWLHAPSPSVQGDPSS